MNFKNFLFLVITVYIHNHQMPARFIDSKLTAKPNGTVDVKDMIPPRFKSRLNGDVLILME